MRIVFVSLCAICYVLYRIKTLSKELHSQRGVGRYGRRGKTSETQSEGPGHGAASDGLYLPWSTPPRIWAPLSRRQVKFLPIMLLVWYYLLILLMPLVPRSRCALSLGQNDRIAP